MENPKSWGKVQKAILEAILEHEKDERNDLIGYYLVTIIFNKLKQNNFLTKEALDDK